MLPQNGDETITPSSRKSDRPMYHVFDANVERYERWFDKNAVAYQSELKAVRAYLPPAGRGMEIGIGTGRFAAPAGITDGIEPSGPMAAVAAVRGARVVRGLGEYLPYKPEAFDYALMVTTICFADDPRRCCREAWRVLTDGGVFVVAFVDRSSFLGRQYEATKQQSVFYRVARFFSTDDVVEMLTQAGFEDIDCSQTIFHSPARLERPEEPVRGHGKGAFVVARGVKHSDGAQPKQR